MQLVLLWSGLFFLGRCSRNDNFRQEKDIIHDSKLNDTLDDISGENKILMKELHGTLYCVQTGP